MQRILKCPKCGSKNVAGQELCSTCRAGLFNGTQYYEWPPLYLLAMDQQSKLILGFKLKSGSTVVLPAITKEGKLSTLPSGSESQFRDLQKRMRDHIKTNYADCPTHICLFLSIMVQDNPKFAGTAIFQVWDISGSVNEMPEMDNFHDSMTRITKVIGDPYWREMEEFFKSEPRRSWINGLVEHLEKQYEWPDYVARKLSEFGFNYDGKWTDEVFVVGELERII